MNNIEICGGMDGGELDFDFDNEDLAYGGPAIVIGDYQTASTADSRLFTLFSRKRGGDITVVGAYDAAPEPPKIASSDDVCLSSCPNHDYYAVISADGSDDRTEDDYATAMRVDQLDAVPSGAGLSEFVED